MSYLTTWLQAQLDKDEREMRRLQALGEQSYPGWEQQLADVAAKRAILALHRNAVAAHTAESAVAWNRAQNHAAASILSIVIATLAEAYMDSPPTDLS